MTQGQGKAKFWRSVFRRVLARYDEMKSVQGTNSCAGFYKGLENESQRTFPNPKVIKSTPEEFFADVEIAARRALNDSEWAYFKAVYLEKLEGYEASASDYYGLEKFTDLKHSVQEKVGKMLQARKIYPVERYFKAKDLR